MKNKKFSNEQRKLFIDEAKRDLKKICKKYEGEIFTQQLVEKLKMEIFDYLQNLNIQLPNLINENYFQEILKQPFTFQIKLKCLELVSFSDINFNKLFKLGE